MTTSTLLAITGTNARITVGGGSPLTASKYSVKVKGVKLPTTNFESVTYGTGAYAESVQGIVDADISFEGSYDSNNTPFGGIGASPGIVTNIAIYVSKTSNKEFVFPQAIITDCTVNTDVNGLVTYSVTATSVGSFTLPT
jgi:hypothetical protein